MTRQRVQIAVWMVALTWMGAASTRAQDVREIFQRGTDSYARGEFEAAVEAWQLLIQANVDDPDLSLNLGNAHAQLGQYGHAIRWFERALRLRPGDPDAEKNLAAVTRALGEARAERDGEATLESRPPFGQLLVRPFSEDALSILVLVFDFLFFALLAAWIRVRAEAGRLGLGIAIPTVGLGLLVAAAGLGTKAGWMTRGVPAVITAASADLRETPDPRALTRSAIAEGARARILDEDGEWRLVELATGERGWLLAESVGSI